MNKLALIDARSLTRDALSRIAAPLERASVRFGDQLLIVADESEWSRLGALARSAGIDFVAGSERSADAKSLHLVVQKGRLFQREHPECTVLVDRGRYLVVSLSPEATAAMRARPEPCFEVRPLEPGTVVFDQRPRGRAIGSRSPLIDRMAARVSPERIREGLARLVAFPTRHSTSPHYPQALLLLERELDALGYRTRREPFPLGAGGSCENLIAELPGSGDGSRDLVLVTAHLDSVNVAGGASAPAPGADDNASGSAGLLELARVFAGSSAQHDLRLVFFGGEEQGLHGSRSHVRGLGADERARISAVINMDMIGSLNTARAAVLLEGSSLSQGLIDRLAEAADHHTSLEVQTSLSPFASDHVPFLQAGIPAVLTIEAADGANAEIHTANDTLDQIDHALATAIVRMNVATAAAALELQESPMPHDSDVLERLRSLVAQMADVLDGAVVSEPPIVDAPPVGLPAPTDIDGRYAHNGGAEDRASAQDLLSDRAFFVNDPGYELREPIYLEQDEASARSNEIRFTLHVDVDGEQALSVVSGTLKAGNHGTRHFVGRVTSDTATTSLRQVVVEDFALGWPTAADTITRLKLDLWSTPEGPQLRAVFEAQGGTAAHGPFEASRTSTAFREVEFEIDREDGAVAIDRYDTHAHPDRPADLPREEITLESVFAKAGIRVSRSSEGNVIDTSSAGPDRRWNEAELHDAMDDHWSAFQNRPQWKMWLFLAERANSDTLGGIMFDGEIDEPGGVDRQGTALFTRCPYFHTEAGGYIQANPPTAEAVDRELFFNLIHETGHAFNLAHSFQKHFGQGWDAPSWAPLQSDDESLSWMNYPDRPTPGPSAKWFYERFRFSFDEGERLFMRHAPREHVRMGDTPWFVKHGRASRSRRDPRIELRVRTKKSHFEFGEPIFVEARVKNVSDEPIVVNANLDPSDGFLEVAVTNPDRSRTPCVSFAQTRRRETLVALKPGESIYQPINLTLGMLGFPFKRPGIYRIEAAFTNSDGGQAGAVLQIQIRRPSNPEDEATLRELFDARIGRVLQVKGTRRMGDVIEKLDWVCDRLPADHPARHALRAAASLQHCGSFLSLDSGSSKVEVLDPDPEIVERHLKRSVLEAPEEAADSLGNIVFREIVDRYSRLAETTKEKASALAAQRTMLQMFEKQGVVTSALKEIRSRVRALE